MRHFNYNLANLGKHLGASALIALYASCNQMKDANLKVAGGTLDSTATYSSTVYVEMNGLDFNGQKKPPVRNVGTFVKIPGLEGFRVLILSLADVLIENGANSQIPLFKEIDLKIYGKDGTASPFVPRLDFDQNSGGVKLAGSAQSDYITAFGFSVVQDGPSEIPKDVFNRMKGRLFSLGSVPNDFRNSRTTFLMLAMREAEVARFGIGPSPTLIPADKRDPSIKKFVVVG